MKSSHFIWIVLILAASCQDPFDAGDDSAPESVINNSIHFFPGTVEKVTDAALNGVKLWQVTIENENGSQVAFYWRKTINNLYKIEGLKGPFDYSLKPPYDVINYTTARFLAINNFSIGNITSWSFEPSPVQNMKWFYIFNGDGEVPKVVLDAGSGTTIR